jgi:hypothetical protein
VLDAGDSWAQLLEGEGVIAKFVPIDFSDVEHVYENCLKVSWHNDAVFAWLKLVSCHSCMLGERAGWATHFGSVHCCYI